MSTDSATPPTVVLDLVAGRLDVDGQPVELRPKTWEVLCVLAERPGELVTKNELLERVWPDALVTEGTLNKSIGELRAALGETPKNPRWIETVPRRGFRWIGRARIVARARSGDRDGPSGAPVAAASTGLLVARAQELARLHGALERAGTGARTFVLVTGEAGAGKTILVDRFLDEIGAPSRSGTVLVAHGQCIETSGPHEPYLPLLDALGRLTRDRARGEAVAAALRQWAPNWAARILDPACVESGGQPGSLPGSMLRELATAIDEIARDRTLVLVLEDIHWSDLASADACIALATRRDPARLLVVATMRRAEALLLENPIIGNSRALLARGFGEEIELVPFGRDALRSYLAQRCPGLEGDTSLVDCLLQQTAGNPLFLRLVVDEWQARSMVALADGHRWVPTVAAAEMHGTIPDNLRTLLELQLARLSPTERAVIEAASVRVGEFQPQAIAAAAGMDAESVEMVCEQLAQRGQLLRRCGTAPTASGRFADQFTFLHATMQNVAAEGLPSSRRRRLHREAALQLESEHGGRGGIASLLAMHYESAGDVARAIPHLREAARQAIAGDAPRDAVATLENVLRLIDAHPQRPDLESERVLALSHLSHARQVAFGFVDPQVGELWSRTSELAATQEDLRERIIADAGRIVVACVCGQLRAADDMVRATLPLVGQVAEPGARKTFGFAAGTVRYRVAAMRDAAALFESALALTHAEEPVPGADLDALLMSQFAPALALAGRIDELREMVDRSLERARAHSQYSECVTGALNAWALGLVGDFAGAAPIAARALAIAESENFRTWNTRPLFLLGMQEIHAGRVEAGIGQARAALAGREGDGQMVDHSAMCCLFADTLLDIGHPEAAGFVDQAAAFAAESGERYAECEIHRLRARILRLAGAPLQEREDQLRQALRLADLREMRWHALLAATDLAADLREHGRHAEVQSLLAPRCGAIDGGSELGAMRRAQNLLAAQPG